MVCGQTNLPFDFIATVRADIPNITGLSQSGLGTDYAESHTPYRLRFDNTGDYMLVYFDSPAETVSIGVKMIGGNSTSSFNIQGSGDGSSYNEIQTFTVIGSQNSIHNFTTTAPIDSEYRYIRIYFNKGSNVGLGTINITAISGNTVTFKGNGANGGGTGGTGADYTQTASTTTALTANTFTRTGYSFDHWNTAADNSGTSYANGANYDFLADMDLFAQWSINQYNVSYDINGGTGTAPTTQTGDYNSNITLADDTGFSRAGYTFTGWNTASDGSGTSYASGGSFTIPANNTNLFAQWQSTLPSITTTGSITAMTAEYGSVSTNRNFSFTGANLIGSQITVTPPAGFEIATTSGGTYSTSLNYAISGGSASGTVYIRLASTTDVGTYSGNVNLSDGTTTANISVPNSTVTPKALTITGLTVNNKVYDGNTTASLGGTPALNGIVNSDVVNLSGTYSATFNNKNVGNNKAVTVSGYTISGADAGNYTLTQPIGLQGNITAKALTISAATIAPKVYDGNNSTGTITPGSLSGLIGTETLTVSATGTFADANVGTNKPASITYTLENGTNDGLATNYSLANGTGNGDITPASPTITPASMNLSIGSTASISSNSSGTMTFTSLNPSVASVDASGLVTGVAAGSTTINLTQAAAGNYSAWSGSVTVNVSEITIGSWETTSNGNWLTAGWRKMTSDGWDNNPGSPPSGTIDEINILHNINFNTTGSWNLAKLIIQNGGILTHSNTNGLTVSSLLIKTNGIVNQNSLLTISDSGIFEIENGGTFNVSYSSNPLALSLFRGTEVFHPDSNFIVKDVSNGNFITAQNGFGGLSATEFNGIDAYFGNLIVDYSGSGTFTLFSNGFNGNITHGNLIFRRVNGNMRMATNNSLGSFVDPFIIGKDLIIESTFSSAISIRNDNYNSFLIIKGDFINNSSSCNFRYYAGSSSDLTITLDIDGDLFINYGNFYFLPS